MARSTKTTQELDLADKIDFARTIYTLKQRMERRRYINTVAEQINAIHENEMNSNGRTSTVDPASLENAIQSLVRPALTEGK